MSGKTSAGSQVSRRQFLKKAGVLIGGTAAVSALIGGPRLKERAISKRTFFLEDEGVKNARQWAEYSFTHNPLSFKKFPLTPAEMKALNRIVEKAGIQGTRKGLSEVERILKTLQLGRREKQLLERFKEKGSKEQHAWAIRVETVWKEFDKLPAEQKHRINQLLDSMPMLE